MLSMHRLTSIYNVDHAQVNFSPVDKYRKHVGSLFHLRKTAGEDVKWIDSKSLVNNSSSQFIMYIVIYSE
jgi:hypothetical protein